MRRTVRVDYGTALNATFKLMRILLATELESGRISPRRLRQLASEIEDRSLDSKDMRDVASAALLRDVVDSTIRTLEKQKRLQAR